MRELSRCVLLLLLPVMAACSASDFSGNGTKKGAADGNVTPKDDGADGTDAGDAGDGVDASDGEGGNDAGGGDDEGGDGGAISDDEKKSGCPDQSQKILILDFKSGWWTGDGGRFVDTAMSGLTSGCEDSISISYHHILDEGVVESHGQGGTFSATGMDQYQQIWLLSGSLADDEDIRLDDGLFRDILGGAKAADANVFIGAGFGSISHANALSAELGIGATFATDQEEGEILDPRDGSKVTSWLETGSGLKSHALTARGVKKIADGVGDQIGEVAHSDFLTSSGPLKVVGKAGGKTVIAAGKAGDRKVVMDGGLQRFYPLDGGGAGDTMIYLRNIVLYLK